jgi:hypothetical protein
LVVLGLAATGSIVTDCLDRERGVIESE